MEMSQRCSGNFSSGALSSCKQTTSGLASASPAQQHRKPTVDAVHTESRDPHLRLVDAVAANPYRNRLRLSVPALRRPAAAASLRDSHRPLNRSNAKTHSSSSWSGRVGAGAGHRVGSSGSTALRWPKGRSRGISCLRGQQNPPQTFSRFEADTSFCACRIDRPSI
jgi:hypothetical protein